MSEELRVIALSLFALATKQVFAPGDSDFPPLSGEGAAARDALTEANGIVERWEHQGPAGVVS